MTDPKRRDYLTDPHELWARAYDQYVAEHSGDTAHQAEISMVRSGIPEYETFWFWKPADFRAVRLAIRQLMIHLDWKPTP